MTDTVTSCLLTLILFSFLVTTSLPAQSAELLRIWFWVWMCSWNSARGWLVCYKCALLSGWWCDSFEGLIMEISHISRLTPGQYEMHNTVSVWLAHCSHALASLCVIATVFFTLLWWIFCAYSNSALLVLDQNCFSDGHLCLPSDFADK